MTLTNRDDKGNVNLAWFSLFLLVPVDYLRFFPFADHYSLTEWVYLVIDGDDHDDDVDHNDDDDDEDDRPGCHYQPQAGLPSG